MQHERDEVIERNKRNPNTFPVELFILWLTNIITAVNDDNVEIDVNIEKDVGDFLTNVPKDEWVLVDEEMGDCLEVLTLEIMVQNMLESEAPELEQYTKHFGVNFFDPEPNPKLSIAGWLNQSFSREYEKTMQELPPVSLHPIVQALDILVTHSPTCDEVLHEAIREQILEIAEDTDGDLDVGDFLAGKGYDQLNDLNRCLATVGRHLQTVREAYTTMDGWIYDLGLVLITDLKDTVQDLEEAFDDSHYKHHPFLLVRDHVEEIHELYI